MKIVHIVYYNKTTDQVFQVTKLVKKITQLVQGAGILYLF